MAENMDESKQKSEMKVLGSHGHMTYQWNKDNDAEVKAARDVFDKYVKKEGWSAFRETIKYEKGVRIEEFDPKAERIILVPPITGGQ